MPAPIEKRSLLQYMMPTYVDQEQERVEAQPTQLRAGRPQLAEVLYAPPNPDGSRKACANCTFWVPSGECDIHAPGTVVPGYAVCGYHVYGKPLPARIPRDNIEYCTPALSGLMTLPGGSSCARCRWFAESSPVQADAGACLAVDDVGGAPASVESNGCCARFMLTEER